MKAAGLAGPTAFEIETALAFLYFQEKHCDIVTPGNWTGRFTGRYQCDPHPVIEVIASISMDHMDCLGDTLEKSPGRRPGSSSPLPPWYRPSSSRRPPASLPIPAARKDCSLRTVDPAQLRDIHYGYDGQSFSYKTWETSRFVWPEATRFKTPPWRWRRWRLCGSGAITLSDEQVRAGLCNTIWRGRFTLLRRDPVVIIDGPQAPALPRS